MAVIQVSQIQVRSGLQQDLPQLATGEFGWSVDTQRLFIGKGTLAEGAPETGVTEILTEYSGGAISISIATLEANVANLTTRVDVIEGNIANITSNISIHPTITFPNNTANANTTITINSLTTSIFDYKIVRDASSRVGTIKVTQANDGDVVWDDDFSQTDDIGVTLYWTANSNVSATLGYTTSNTGVPGTSSTFTYYQKSFLF